MDWLVIIFGLGFRANVLVVLRVLRTKKSWFPPNFSITCGKALHIIKWRSSGHLVISDVIIGMNRFTITVTRTVLIGSFAAKAVLYLLLSITDSGLRWTKVETGTIHELKAVTFLINPRQLYQCEKPSLYIRLTTFQLHLFVAGPASPAWGLHADWLDVALQIVDRRPKKAVQQLRNNSPQFISSHVLNSGLYTPFDHAFLSCGWFLCEGFWIYSWFVRDCGCHCGGCW